MVFQFKIQIKNIAKPPVWRRVSVPADFSFLQFHEVIQTVFGWEGEHLFEFEQPGDRSGHRIAMPMEEDEFYAIEMNELTTNASDLRLSDIFKKEGQKYIYEYDFGDSWEHAITLESILDTQTTEAVCLTGKGACLPEDCGGFGGYEMMKEIFEKNPNSKEANEYREWLGLDDDENWNTDFFDLDAVNKALKGL